MGNKIYYILLCISLIAVANAYCNDYILPMNICTKNKTLDEFFSEFNLGKINKIELRTMGVERRIDKFEKTIKNFSDKEDIGRVISELKQLKCIRLTLSGTPYELWLFENDILRLKLALSIGNKLVIVRFFKPDQLQYWDVPLNRSDMAIENEEFCLWLRSFI